MWEGRNRVRSPLRIKEGGKEKLEGRRREGQDVEWERECMYECERAMVSWLHPWSEQLWLEQRGHVPPEADGGECSLAWPADLSLISHGLRWYKWVYSDSPRKRKVNHVVLVLFLLSQHLHQEPTQNSFPLDR